MEPGEESNRFEALVGRGYEASRFDAAFFRFLECWALAGEDGPMIIQSLPEGDFERKTVVLWSDAATAEFARFWRGSDAVGSAAALMASADALCLD